MFGFSLHAYMELSTTHKILKTGLETLDKEPIFLFLCPESFPKVGIFPN